MLRRLTALGFAALLCVACTQNAAADTPLSPLHFLVGNWKGGGKTDVGQAKGVSSIKLDLDGHILVRRDRTDLPATKEQPASVMSVLMLIYSSPTDGHLHATYTDSGGHTIQYTAARVEPGHLVEFDSDASPTAPTFRLTYAVSGPKSLTVKFEMSPPGAASAFHPIAVGTLTRAAK